MDVRWWILFNCCLIGFANDFSSEESSTLVQRLTGTADACRDGSDMCTYLSIEQFNFLFTASSLSAAIGAIVAGLITDRYGCKIILRGVALTIITGSATFAGGTYIKSTNAVFATLMTGCVLCGLGGGAFATISHRIKASWFLYKELALAFATQIFFNRLGSAISFLVIGALVPLIGLAPCLWLGVSFVAVASCCIVVLSFLNERDSTMFDTSPPTMSASILWSVVLSLDGVYWSFAGIATLFYGAVSAFTANGPNFLAKGYGYSESVAAYLVGIVYDISLFCILFGWLIDRYGKRDYWLLGAAGLLFLAFILELSIPHFPAWLLTTIIGFGYTIFGPTIYSSVPLIVFPSYIGTAMGFMKFCQFVGSGIITALVGVLLQVEERAMGYMPWLGFIAFLFALTALCVLIGGSIVFFNLRTGKRLTPPQNPHTGPHVPQEITPLLISKDTTSDNG